MAQAFVGDGEARLRRPWTGPSSASLATRTDKEGDGRVMNAPRQTILQLDALL